MSFLILNRQNLLRIADTSWCIIAKEKATFIDVQKKKLDQKTERSASPKIVIERGKHSVWKLSKKSQYQILSNTNAPKMA